MTKRQAKRISIFGSGSSAEGSPEFRLAYEVGFGLAQKGFIIVNGGYGGVMLASAKGAKESGGCTVGMTTSEFPRMIKNNFVDEEICKPTWRERLHALVDFSDGFVVLNGGTGTLTELCVVWEMRNKNLHAKPVVILGDRIKNVIEVLKKNPEVLIPRDLFYAQTADDAVKILSQSLLN